MSKSPDLAQQRMRIARETRNSRVTGDDQAITDARRDYAAAKLADYVQRVVAAAPPLTADQRDRISTLLRGGAR